jgi:hypothetical protein
MSIIDIKVPDIGDFKDVAIIEVLVKPGDTIRAEQSLLTVESDKASMEIPSSHAGVVKEMKVKLGDTVSDSVPGSGRGCCRCCARGRTSACCGCASCRRRGGAHCRQLRRWCRR